MAGEGMISVEGRLGGDPDVKFLDSGVSVSKMSVANTQRTKDKDGNWVDRETLWYRVEYWGVRGEAASENLRKGDLVLVKGAVYQSSWTDKNGDERKDVVIRADVIGKVFTSAPNKAKEQETDESDPW